MERLLTGAKVTIFLENDHLIMYGSTTESAGCVLRGVMNLNLQEQVKLKSINLKFSGKMIVSWTEGRGSERSFTEVREVISHNWSFLPRQAKIHTLQPGNYSYEFELPIPGDMPESSYIHNFYVVEYGLKATIERSSFLPNMVHRKKVHISRKLQPFSSETQDPITLSNQWLHKLDYEITLPSKVYTHGDKVPITIKITPLTESLSVRHLSISLKEYMICRAGQPQFNHRSRVHSRVVASLRDAEFGQTTGNSGEWKKTEVLKLPTSSSDLQCDLQNDLVRIRHKVKFVLSLENSDGHISELRGTLPVSIFSFNNQGLPTYEETWRSLPYDPSIMVALLQHSNSSALSPNISTLTSNILDLTHLRQLPSYHSIANSPITPLIDSNGLPPTYDELMLCLSH
ncbi:hypothetical protein BDB01DRAFT_754289 [Pilobolus umbonatus]|nr:hypothetical protein BDB01DRAFT_754289 [Pilobolus umbonatus]